MNIENKKPKIYLICGSARRDYADAIKAADKSNPTALKNSIAHQALERIAKFYEEDGKKVIYSRAGKYIKFYAMEMTDWDGSEESKPRKLLQELGTDVIRNKLNKAEMFIERQLDDIEIYSYFYDAIIVPDIRLPREIDSVREKFDNVVVIKVERINFETSLDSKEQAHVTEIAMDNYDDVDYIVTNDTLDKLEKDIYDIYKETR